VSASLRPKSSAATEGNALPPIAGADETRADWQRAHLRGIESGFSNQHASDRQSLLTALAAATRDAIATGNPAAAILLDLNNFADINASWGPGAGDEVLETTAARVAQFVTGGFAPTASRQAVTAGRLDADHFLIAVPDAPSMESLTAAATELVRLLSQPLAIGGQAVAIGARAAIVRIPAHGRTITSILGRGFRLLNGIARGSAGGVAASESAAVAGMTTIALERDLAAALSAGQISIALQPKVETGTRAVKGAEALARWQHSDRGWVAPPIFIEAAERSGLIFDLGLSILRQSCRASMMLAGRGADLTIAVNVSAHQLAHPDFLGRFLEVVDREGVEPKMLEIEVTETAAMMGGERVLASLQAIRRCGIAVAIDDFGTGFSNLATLGSFPADILKIDRSLVMNVEQNARAAALLDIALQLGRTFGLTTVVEGVETAGQFEKVKELGCDLVQGYFTGRPVAVAEFAERYLRMPV